MTREEAENFVAAVVAMRNVVDDATALSTMAAFPMWRPGVLAEEGKRFKRNGKLYKVKSEHTTQADWLPESTPALYEPIDIEHKGTRDDPIIAVAGMTYYYDKYYIENEIIYRCTREDAANGVVLQYLPSALIGQYFEIIT